MENIRHSSSLKIISVTFCNNRDAAYRCQSPLSTSIVPLQVLSTGLGENRSCTLEWMNSSGKRLMLFAQSIFSTFRSSQHSISSVTVYTRLCMMYLEVYAHMIAHISTRCTYVCAYDDTSRLDFSEKISTSFDYTYSIWDAEWWWVSRLDFLMRTRLVFEICVSISTRFFYQISTRFLCVDLGIFSPRNLTNCPSYATLAKSTTSRHIL